jgi:hypothetical protein
MKEIFMKNVIKLSGIIRGMAIITFLAVIAFSMAGCDDFLLIHTCETCHGTGKCKECLGAREVPGYKDVYTSYVDSNTGKTLYSHELEEVMVTCSYCSGSGKCWTCKGKGKVSGGGDGKFHF